MQHTYKLCAWVCALALMMSSCGRKREFTTATTKVEQGDVVTSVTATGTIEPVTSVDVGTQVSGIVSKLYVDYNSIVKAGQVIAELDKTNLISELNSAKANLTSQQSNLNYQKTNYERFQNLFNKGLISANEFEQAQLSYLQAQQQVATTRENVKRAETNLGYATIKSPIDGIVLSKEVEEGQTVAASFNTPTLFKIAQDLTQMRVIADIDEADIGEVREGQRVTFTVDAYPNDVFEGSVTQVRQQPSSESNVVTYEVVINAPNDNLKLKPGLTANITIFTLEVKNVTYVASKALRFTPNDQMLLEGESIKDCNGKQKLWVREGSVIKAYSVETGTTNGTVTEIRKCPLKVGADVITDIVEAMPDMGEQMGGNPFMPRPRNNDKNKPNGKRP
ncbi:MAG: efflux RND transporter periplasmic adaptor subunit [Bacteroidaceae bacterium]|nr:efflux RND transporter periplasmic adaptor subunit [Bacteroidaceae bacterium]